MGPPKSVPMTSNALSLTAPSVGSCPCWRTEYDFKLCFLQPLLQCLFTRFANRCNLGIQYFVLTSAIVSVGSPCNVFLCTSWTISLLKLDNLVK